MNKLVRRIATVLLCSAVCSCSDDPGAPTTHADGGTQSETGDTGNGSTDTGDQPTETESQSGDTSAVGTGSDDGGAGNEPADGTGSESSHESMDGGGATNDDATEDADTGIDQPTTPEDSGADDTTEDAGPVSVDADSGGDGIPPGPRPACEGDGEPNESIATSCTVSIGETVAGTLTTHEQDGADCYSVALEKGVTYSVMVEKTSGAGGNAGTSDNLFVELTTPSGIDHLDYSIEDNRAYINQLAPTLVSEVATLCLTAGSPNEQYNYRFWINPDWESGLVQDEVTFEPNDTPAMAHLATVGQVWASTITTERSEMVDCYRFEMEADVTYSVMVEKTSGAGGNAGTSDNLFVELTTPSGIEHLDYSIEDNRAYIDQLAPTLVSELATLCFRAGAHGSQYDYRFRVNEDWKNDLEHDDVTFEPNDTQAMAYLAPLGDVVESTITTDRSEMVDCYRFDMEADVTYSVMVEKTGGAGGSAGTGDNLFVELTTPSGIDHLDYSIGDDRAYIHQLAPTLVSELASLCFRAGAHASSYQYRFRIDVDRQHGLEHDDTTFEPNDTPAMAYPISLEETVVSSLTTVPSEYIDCFEFGVEAGTSYYVTIEKTDGAGGEAGTSDDLFVTLASPIGGEAFIDFGSDVVADYEFTAAASEPATLCFTAGSHTSQYAYSFSVLAL